MAIFRKGFYWDKTKWVLEEDYCVFYGRSNINWDSSDGWLSIRDGVWRIKAGFIWDGCTDIEDFKSDIDPETKKPKVYYPSLCHDVGYRYLKLYPETFPYNKFQIDLFFFRLLKKYRFQYAGWYFFGVLVFGRFYI